ncbi:MAG: helicase-related protein, partial [bacterium]
QWEHHEENRKIVVKIVAKWRRFGFLSDQDQRRLMAALQNMRMACNSTFLLDKKTDYGVKADEATLLLEETLETPDTKAVVFSQWIGTHQLLMDRLDPKKCGHVFFHGSLDSRERNKLLQRFKEDPLCRVFLSTDSGGVGLNLQHASVVVNMDQPWNPAVLEQRIGRVHRLGQHRNVRVVHFVSKGTIEHRMLDVLAFKKSVFSGVLDGGADEVFLGGSKLKKFMETVENVTEGMPAGMPEQEEMPEAEDLVADDTGLVEEETASRDRSRAKEDVWDELISAGVEFIGKASQAIQQAGGGGDRAKPATAASAFITKDDQTGETVLKLPMPKPDTIKKLADALGALANIFQSQGGTKDESAE